MQLSRYSRGKSPVLSIKNLTVEFLLEDNVLQAVKGINLDIYPGEIVALVGESGSGKSVSCYSILSLLPKNAKVEGEIIFENNNLLSIPKKQLREIRGNKISMVFQEPSAVLNPLLTVGEQLIDTILAHKNISKEKAKNLALEVMRKVSIPDPEHRFYQYPFELSGGLKQRVAIAIASLNNPKVLLADEPTTALDLTVSVKILTLFENLKKEGIGILLITHDLGVVAQVADWVYVMQNGKIVEQGNVFDIFDNPKHTYTKKLLSSRVKTLK